MLKINREEYEVLKGLDDKWKWMARDEDRGLYAFTKKPVRKEGPLSYWRVTDWRDAELEGPFTALGLFDEIHLFQFIQWEDEDPYNIAELIEEYEEGLDLKEQMSVVMDRLEEVCGIAMKEVGRVFGGSGLESEETEVKKDIEWAKDEIRQIAGKFPTYHDERDNKIKMMASMHDVLAVLDQLDDPEVLSSDWISKNVEYAYFDMLDGSGRLSSATAIIKPEKLKNLLVPKQEEITHKQVEKYLLDKNIRVIDIDIYEEMQSDLAEIENKIVIEKPVIPKFVADYIDDRKEVGFPIYQAIRIVRENSRFEHSHLREWLWTNKGQETFARAWLDGYEVVEEREQKYYVDLESAAYVAKWDGNGQVDIYTDGISGSDEYEFYLTEQEIKDYDERFWPFAVKVEELEE